MKPLLSICCTAYNQENYIVQALEGFLMQKTTFPIEIIVHDDASTDRTADIIKEYAKKDNRFVTILQSENQYSKNVKPWANFVFPKAQGKYIALCEGDDYWTDPMKLQRQVDFLENNSDYALCAHHVKIYIEKSKEFRPDSTNVPETTTNAYLANRCYLHTNTVVLRNNFVLENWFSYLPVGDWPLFLIQSQNGLIMKLKDVMSVYRVHDKGVWSGINRYKSIETTLKTIEPLIKYNVLPEATTQVLIKKYRKYKFKLFKEGIRVKIRRFFNT